MPTIEEEIKQKQFANEHLKAMINILFTANQINNRVNTALKPYNLTHEQFNVLRILQGAHPKVLCQKDIQQRMVARYSNVTLILNKLKQRDLILVARAEHDGREHAISLTKSGKDLQRQVIREAKEELAGSTSLSVSEAFHLNALLDKLRGN